MTTALFRLRRHRRRATLVIGLVLVLLLTGAGVATARWITAATTTPVPVAAGSLSTSLTVGPQPGPVRDNQYAKPVTLTLGNPNPVPVDYTLTFSPASGSLALANVGLAVWRPTGTTCPETTPTTGVTTGTLAAPPTLRIPSSLGGTPTVVCAAARFTGTLAGSAGQSRAITPKLEARMTTGTWTATANGTPFVLTMASPNPVTTVQCDPWNFLIFRRGVALSWDQVPGATGYEITSSTGQPLEGVSNPLPPNRPYVNVGGYLPDVQWISVTTLGPTGKSAPTQKAVYFDTSSLGNALRCGN